MGVKTHREAINTSKERLRLQLRESEDLRRRISEEHNALVGLYASARREIARLDKQVDSLHAQNRMLNAVIDRPLHRFAAWAIAVGASVRSRFTRATRSENT